jgi:GAF domain-containing protein
MAQSPTGKIMHEFIESLLLPYRGIVERWRALGVYLIGLVYVATRLLLLWPDALDRAAAQIGWGRAPLAVAHVLFLAAAGTALLLTRRGELRTGTLILTGVLLVEGSLYLLGDGWHVVRGWAELWTGVVLAGLLLDRRSTGLVTGAALIVLTISAFSDIRTLSPGSQNERVVLYLAAVLWTGALAGLTSLTVYGSQQAIQAAVHNNRVRHLIELNAETARHLFARVELDEFLEHIAAFLVREFETIDHVQIYLIEPGSQHATLRAATGLAGQRLLAQEHALHIGGLSVVGRVTLTGHPLLISDSVHDPIHKPHPLLPETRAELAIPLRVSDDIIGAIDFQSNRVNAFDDLEIALLTAVNNQITTGIDALRLYEAAQRSTRENQALYQQAQANLREIERLNFQLTGHAWADYLRSQPDTTAITLDLKTRQMESQAEWTPTLNEATEHHQVITTTESGRRIVALPIIVRNEAIGAMEFELDRDEPLPDGAMELVTAVSQRLGLAMENRRLFDETQRVAQRETLINDIAADLQSATGIDTIIQRAARHLQQTLSAQQVTIHLDTLPNEPGQTKERS